MNKKTHVNFYSQWESRCHNFNTWIPYVYLFQLERMQTTWIGFREFKQYIWVTAQQHLNDYKLLVKQKYQAHWTKTFKSQFAQLFSSVVNRRLELDKLGWKVSLNPLFLASMLLPMKGCPMEIPYIWYVHLKVWNCVRIKWMILEINTHICIAQPHPIPMRKKRT